MTPKKPYAMPLPSLVEKSTQLVSGVGATAIDANLQAALARVKHQDPTVAERFELYLDGIELANGFHELCDATEQRARFERDLAQRHARGKKQPPLDERLLAALAAGLPDCSGVAVGFDRVVMAAIGARGIDEVIAFPADRA